MTAVDLHSVSPAPTFARRGSIDRRVLMAVLAVLTLAGATWLALRQSPPQPNRLNSAHLLGQAAELDPQVREHLGLLAERAAAAAAAAESAEPDRWIDLALALAVNGLWAEARSAFDWLKGQVPREPLPALYAAVALQEEGDLEGARREMDEVVTRFPACAPAWQRLGSLRILTGEFVGAEEAYTHVIRLAPEEWRGWAGLGEALLRQGREIEAVKPLERAVGLDPFARSARHLLSQAYQSAGRPEEAARERMAGKGQTVGPMPDAWSARALHHMKLLPDQFERADALLARGDADQAVNLLREALRFHPGHRAVEIRLAGALVAAGHVQDAWRVLEPALRRGGTAEVALLVAASEVAAATGDSDQALSLARQAVERSPETAEPRVAMANALLSAGRDGESVEALRAAIERAPDNVGLWLQLGDVQWRNLGDLGGARASYGRTRQLDPIHPVALERLAEVSREAGDEKEVRRYAMELARLRSVPEWLKGVEDRR